MNQGYSKVKFWSSEPAVTIEEKQSNEKPTHLNSPTVDNTKKQTTAHKKVKFINDLRSRDKMPEPENSVEALDYFRRPEPNPLVNNISDTKIAYQRIKFRKNESTEKFPSSDREIFLKRETQQRKITDTKKHFPHSAKSKNPDLKTEDTILYDIKPKRFNEIESISSEMKWHDKRPTEGRDSNEVIRKSEIMEKTDKITKQTIFSLNKTESVTEPGGKPTTPRHIFRQKTITKDIEKDATTHPQKETNENTRTDCEAKNVEGKNSARINFVSDMKNKALIATAKEINTEDLIKNYYQHKISSPENINDKEKSKEFVYRIGQQSKDEIMDDWSFVGDVTFNSN